MRRAWLLLALFGCDDGGSTAQEAPDPDAGDAMVAPDTGVHAAVDAAVDAGQDAAPDAELDAALPDANPDAAPPPGPVTAPGPYPVGYRTDSVTYTVSGLDVERTLRIVYWYPAAAPDGGGPRYGGIVLRNEVHSDAPLARRDPLPVLLFSHGNQGFAEQSYGLTEFFASRGWLVVSFDHTGNTFNNNTAPREQLYELRPKDVTAVLDHVYGLQDDPLAGRLTPHVVMTGHSFGGFTTLAASGAGFNLAAFRAACEEQGDCSGWDAVEPRFAAGFADARVIAAAPLTPSGAFVLGPGLADVEIPTMIVTAGRDRTLPNETFGDPIWAGVARGDNLRLDFPNAGHFSFTSFCNLGVGVDDGCGEGFTPPEDVLSITNAYLLAFARLHLLGDDADADLLDGSRTLTDIVDVTFPEDP